MHQKEADHGEELEKGAFIILSFFHSFLQQTLVECLQVSGLVFPKTWSF